MAIPSVPLGAVVRLTLAVASSSGSTVGADPGSLSFGLREPDGTTYAYTWGGSTNIATSSAGGFYLLWTTAKEGIHRFGWQGSSANAGAQEGAFNVIQRSY